MKIMICNKIIYKIINKITNFSKEKLTERTKIIKGISKGL